MLVVYAATLAPSVTFWDSGEFIAAARVLGIPHPPGTPIFVLLLNVWGKLLSFLPFAVATNFLSAVCTAAAVGLTVVWMGRSGAIASAAAAGITAGAMVSVWQNATETEVYAASLALALATIVVADRFGRSGERRWLVLTSYLLALAIPLHASALIAAPVVIFLAAWRSNVDGVGVSQDWHAGAALTGVAVCAIGASRLSVGMMTVGLALVLATTVVGPRSGRLPRSTVLAMAASIAVAFSALLFMLIRARHDPAINQGNPSTWHALIDVIGRRQYDVQGVWPRQAPIWLQLANWFEYADWQFALSLGPTVIPTVARVTATVLFAVLAVVGAQWHRRVDRRTWTAVLLLLVCGTLGVIVYLNLKAGISFAWELVPDGARHEARERDYFFVLGFWAWGIWTGMGAMVFAQRLRLPRAVGFIVAGLPIALNWSAVTRRGGVDAELPREVAVSLLDSAPKGAVLVVAGDNDTYPLWYAQRVEHVRPDVTVVTTPLLEAGWYAEELARREELIAQPNLERGPAALRDVAASAARQGRPLAVAMTVPASDRDIMSRTWTVIGPVLFSSPDAIGLSPSPERPEVIRIDTTATRAAATAFDGWRRGRSVRPAIDPVNEYFMKTLSCPGLSLVESPSVAQRASLDSTCNLGDSRR